MIEKWTDWKHLLSDSIDEFFNTYSYYPNILEANEHTYSQFDFLINAMPNERTKVKNEQNLNNEFDKSIEKEHIKISSFDNVKTSVDFAIDIKLKDKEIRLIYDSEPDWSDDDIIIDLPAEEIEKVKI